MNTWLLLLGRVPFKSPPLRPPETEVNREWLIAVITVLLLLLVRLERKLFLTHVSIKTEEIKEKLREPHVSESGEPIFVLRRCGLPLSVRAGGTARLRCLAWPDAFGATLAFGFLFGLACFSNLRHIFFFHWKCYMPAVRMVISSFLFIHSVSIRQLIREHLWARRLHQRYSDEKDRQDLGPRGGTVLCPAVSQKWFGGYYNAEASFFSDWLHSLFFSPPNDLEQYPCIWP